VDSENLNNNADVTINRIVMLRTKDDEDQVVRWAFAETVNYLKQKHDHYWFKYNFKHWRVHKILYNVFEKMDIPVTRSWYRYGCFIHSTQLAGFENFSSLKNRYLASHSFPERLRAYAADIGVDVKSALREMREIIDAMPSRMDLYLESLYEDAPKNLGSIYLAKLKLHQSLNFPNRTAFKNLGSFHKWFLEVRRNVSVFHMVAFPNRQFDDLSDIVVDFSSNLEEAILKVEMMSHLQNKVFKKWSTWMGEFSEFFDENVWHPFALEISTLTVKGLRKEEEKLKFRKRKIEKATQSLAELATLSKNLSEKGLTLSYQDYLRRLKLSRVSKDVADAISEMEKIYEKTSRDTE